MRYIRYFIEKNRNNLELFLKINKIIFLITTLVYLLLLIMNLLLYKYFEEYINIYVIFIILLISGIFFLLSIFEEIEKVNIKRNLERVNIFLFLIMGLICSVLVWMKIKDFGTISYIISVIAGLITLVLPTLLFYDQ